MQAQEHNILFIIADDLGVDALNGYHVIADQATTPHLDSLRESGLSFLNAWSSPVCTPTRAGMMSGKYGSKTGVKTAPGNLDTIHTSLAKAIKSFDPTYTMAVTGKWHISHPSTELHPKWHGLDHYAGIMTSGVSAYDSWDKTENDVTATTIEYATSFFTDNAISWINAQQSNPWVMWLAHVAPHTPLHIPPAHMHTQNSTNTNLKKFKAMIESIDYEVGRLLDSLSTEDKNNLTIIFIGDNGTSGNLLQGFPAGRGKQTLYEGGIHVPMFVCGKGVTRVGEEDSSLVNVIDIHASILELIGQDLPGGLHNSFSFTPLLTNKNSPSRKYNFTELDANGSGITVQGYAIRNKQYKLIKYADNSEEFFDLITDTFELSNLVLGTLTNEQQAIKDELIAEAQERITSWSCNDGIQNGDETGIDCGGIKCSSCLSAEALKIQSEHLLQLFPNPTKNLINVQSIGEPIQSITVRNTLGTTLLQLNYIESKTASFSIDNLQPQVLFVSVSVGQSEKVFKVIKE